MTKHYIKPDETTLHGYFSRDLQPALTIESGDTVCYETLDARWQYINKDENTLAVSPHKAHDPKKGHALCGPIAITGAKKGMVLEVQIGDIVVDRLGWNIGGGPQEEGFGQLGTMQDETHFVQWALDAEAGMATNHLNHRIKIKPFMGVLGVPPGEAGQHLTGPPRFCGGNIDCKELVTGSRLYLPITVDGGLFSTGDGHAAQGDGEVSGTAIECPIKQANLTFILHDDMTLTTPRARVPGGWITLGVHEDLDEATFIALNAMLDLMMEHYNIARPDALSLASVVVDMRITQIVNGVKGVHAFLADDAIMTGDGS